MMSRNHSIKFSDNNQMMKRNIVMQALENDQRKIAFEDHNKHFETVNTDMKTSSMGFRLGPGGVTNHSSPKRHMNSELKINYSNG